VSKTGKMSVANWIAIIAVIITAAIATAAGTTELATRLFFSQSDGAALRARIEVQHKAQSALNGSIQSELNTQREVIQDININVVKIGERLKVGDLRRERDQERDE
jgi:hypothetical protein